ncbi:uncharacterized protein CDV56_101667 [Aspergillus thermomutatus]|uniref:AB hydrolase-1 domain-containing protein n=1 Tax=Aspergillus thermomutatus TaxID=41047 RepID=A0A397GN30_ASPTH|nr:uncharacterized protein CDV56_101667 [Aspergillus thermomutatus]RHZ49380.1 hypothetical protein CDV56_101667 [Aspergillus thermomutatus]
MPNPQPHRRQCPAPGAQPAIFFLHGFGACKEDLHDILRLPAFADHTFLAYDAPGCGESSSDLSKTTITTAQAVLVH